MWAYGLNRHSNLESHLIIKHQFYQIELYSSLLNDVLLSEKPFLNLTNVTESSYQMST